MTSHLVLSDQHSHPDFSNDRADYLANLILDLRPDVVINIGDAADMASLSAYDKGKRSFQGRSYRKDIDAHLDFQERVWGPVKRRKKKLPLRIFCEGNHEHRIERALDLSPELEGTIGFKDLQIEDYYDEVVRYSGSTPGAIEVDGITYAHYFVSGVLGRPIGGDNQAASILTKRFSSATCGHSHIADFACRTGNHGRKIMATVCGVFQDYDAPWAGILNQLWWKGVVFKDNVENGVYDPTFISLNTLRKTYGNS